MRQKGVIAYRTRRTRDLQIEFLLKEKDVRKMNSPEWGAVRRWKGSQDPRQKRLCYLFGVRPKRKDRCGLSQPSGEAKRKERKTTKRSKK